MGWGNVRCMVSDWVLLYQSWECLFRGMLWGLSIMVRKRRNFIPYYHCICCGGSFVFGGFERGELFVFLF